MQKLELWILKSAILDVETIPALEHLMENVLSYIVQRRSCAISFEKKTQFERLSNFAHFQNVILSKIQNCQNLVFEKGQKSCFFTHFR